MTSTDSESTEAQTPSLKRTHSWPPSQWYLDQCSVLAESPIASPEQLLAEETVDYIDRPASFDIPKKRVSYHEVPPTTESQEESESESVRAASITTIYPSTNTSRATLHSGLASQTSSISGKATPAFAWSARERKVFFRNRHLKRWSHEMSRTSKRMARALHLPRRNKESSKSPEKNHDPLPELRRTKPEVKTEVRNPPHEMSLDQEEPATILPVPPPTVPERRSTVEAPTQSRGRTLDLPRRDLLDLNGGIQAAAGMPHQMRKRHASGKRKASREPERTLQDIKEEWNASQVHRDAWAARVNAHLPVSPTKFVGRASSDSSVPSALLST